MPIQTKINAIREGKDREKDKKRKRKYVQFTLDVILCWVKAGQQQQCKKMQSFYHFLLLLKWT